MKAQRFATICCTLMLSVVPVAVAAPLCDVNAAAPQDARSFARIDDQGTWREFPSIQDIPDLDTDSEDTAQFWQSAHGQPSVYIVESGEDFSIYTRYCFGNAGNLERLGFEVRTAWGWGYRLSGSVLRGKLHVNSSAFFSTDDERAIARPEGASDIPEALRPTLYLTMSKLPFARLLSGPVMPNRK